MKERLGVHDLKTWPEPFQAAWERRKPYEVRKNDRGYEVGDQLILREWLPCTCGTTLIPLCGGDRCKDLGGAYTNRIVYAFVTYMTAGGAWGMPADLCVLGLKVTARIDMNKRRRRARVSP